MLSSSVNISESEIFLVCQIFKAIKVAAFRRIIVFHTLQLIFHGVLLLKVEPEEQKNKLQNRVTAKVDAECRKIAWCIIRSEDLRSCDCI